MSNGSRCQQRCRRNAYKGVEGIPRRIDSGYLVGKEFHYVHEAGCGNHDRLRQNLEIRGKRQVARSAEYAQNQECRVQLDPARPRNAHGQSQFGDDVIKWVHVFSISARGLNGFSDGDLAILLLPFKPLSGSNNRMTIKEQVTRALDSLTHAELQQIAEYLAFLKLRSRIHPTSPLNATQLAALYADCADEDRSLAEDGMAEYSQSLLQEDAE